MTRNTSRDRQQSHDERKKSLISRQEADEILRTRYPTEEELSRFPLGEVLVTIPEVNEKYGPQRNKKGEVIDPGHIARVIDGANIILGADPDYIVQQWKDHPNPIEENRFTQARIAIFKGSSPTEHPYCQLKKEDFGPFFRLLALYHDVGKFIIHERHPLIGWHLIKDVYQQEVEAYLYPLLLGIPYNEWDNRDLSELSKYEKRLISIFEAVIRFHDLFGVLSTGEGSLPVMVDLVPLTGARPQDAKELFSLLMLLNLADLYGSVPEVLPEKVNFFCDDWKLLCDAIESAKGNRQRFFAKLLRKEQQTDRTIERIGRLMNEGAPREWRGQPINDRLTDMFAGSTLAGMHAFCTNFALFCKLDYALAFKLKIMQRAHAEKMHVTRPMARILWLLAQLEKQYGDLCKRKDGTWRRIGVEMAGLTRKPSSGRDRSVSKIGDTICDLLLKTEEKGKQWSAGECTVWFMEE